MKLVGLSELPAFLRAAQRQAASRAAGASAIQRVAADVPEEEREEETKAAESAIYCANMATHRFSRPVRLSRSDFGSLDRQKRRPLAEYDDLTGPPFWSIGG